ncbi:MAG: hypothetical protein E7F26_14705, partial [Proteus mirabilis]|nr:hypothetical protein [Proteus mirabilis]
SPRLAIGVANKLSCGADFELDITKIDLKNKRSGYSTRSDVAHKVALFRNKLEKQVNLFDTLPLLDSTARMSIVIMDDHIFLVVLIVEGKNLYPRQEVNISKDH